jgi:amino acid permease
MRKPPCLPQSLGQSRLEIISGSAQLTEFCISRLLLSFSVSYLCTCVGAGVLSLPGALQYSGWVGLILMALVAVLCNITAKYLSACQFARPGQMLRTYEDIGEQALGIWGRRIVAFFQIITLFGVCTIFLILIGGNMNTLVGQLSLHDWIFIFAALLIPIAWLKTMNEVSVLALFGVIASLYVAAVVVIKGFLRAADPEGGATIHYDVVNWNGLSNAINIIVFSFGGHSVLPNIISHVQQPKKNYAKVTTYSYFLIAVIYMLTAAGGYAGWGVDTQDKILDNMNDSSPVVKAAYAFITAHVVLAYPIPLNPISLALEDWLGTNKKTGKSELASRIVGRTILVLLTVLVASVVPYFGDILSLVSALSIVVVAFVLPPWFYYLLHPHKTFTTFELATMIFIVVFGVLSSGIGIYYAIKDLVHDVKNNPNPFDNYF